MTKIVELEVAQATLREIVERLQPGDEVTIVRGQQALAKLVAAGPRSPRVPGLLKGQLTIVAEDDEHLKGFAGSMS